MFMHFFFPREERPHQGHPYEGFRPFPTALIARTCVLFIPSGYREVPQDISGSGEGEGRLRNGDEEKGGRGRRTRKKEREDRRGGGPRRGQGLADFKNWNIYTSPHAFRVLKAGEKVDKAFSFKVRSPQDAWKAVNQHIK